MAMVSSVVMHATMVATRVLTETPTPTPTPGSGVSESEVANRMPGLPSFIVFAFLAVILYFLLRNMNARLRRMSYREREREAAEAEAARLEQSAGVDTVEGVDVQVSEPAVSDTEPPAPEASEGENPSAPTDSR